MYEAGKAVKKGMGGQYAATLYTPSMYGQPAYTTSLMNQPTIPMLPIPNGAGGVPPHNGYGRDFDNASSGWILCDQVFSFESLSSVYWSDCCWSCAVGQGSQVPLLQDQEDRSESFLKGITG